MEFFKREIITSICDIVNLSSEEIDLLIEIPPNSNMGDFAFPCFQLSKTLKKAPSIIAKELKDKICLPESIERVESTGGYLNFFMNKTILSDYVINEIRTKRNIYGSGLSGNGKTALVEHTSINPNASPHVGRARNALIGDTIVRILRFEGFDVDTHYFVNDVGKQISMLLLGTNENNNVSFKDLLDVYVNVNNSLKENPNMETKVFDLLYRLENGDRETREKFRNIVQICIDGQSEILGKLNIMYNSFDFESDYIFDNRTKRILDALNQTGNLFEDENGRMVLNLEDYNLIPLVVTRADKTSLYPLRDIAYTIDKSKTNSDKNIIVLGEDQKLYFKQVAAAVEMLGYEAPQVVHYSFVLLAEGKMSTRKGTVVLLEDLMNEAVAKAKNEIEKRHETANLNIAKAIGYGAVKYTILKASNEKNVMFDWDAALNFEGDSALYIQYSYARINSILEKYGKPLSSKILSSVFKEPEEFKLIKELATFPDAVKRTLYDLSPHIICNYVYGLTKKFSIFYHECPVLNIENEDLKNARLALCDAVRQVIENCLYLLGIDTVEHI